MYDFNGTFIVCDCILKPLSSIFKFENILDHFPIAFVKIRNYTYSIITSLTCYVL